MARYLTSLLGVALATATAAAAAETSRSVELSQLDRALQVGVRVSVKGDPQPDGTLRAAEVELEQSGDTDEEIQGSIRELDTQAGTFVLGGRVVRVRPKTEIVDDKGEAAGSESLRDGLRVKVEGDPDAEGRLKADEIRIYPNQAARSRIKIEGVIQSLEGSAGLARMRVAGFDVELTLSTELIGARGGSRPIASRLGGIADDEELQFTRNTRIGKYVVFAGEVRLRAEYLSGLELDEEVDDTLLVPEIAAQLGFLARLGPALGYLTFAGFKEFPILGEERFDAGDGTAQIGEAYLQMPLARGVSVAIGRQRFNDEREWYFNARRLDAVRLFADLHPVRLEASVSRNLFDQTRNFRDQNLTNLIVQADYRVAREIDLQAYFVDRQDRTERQDSPRTVGLRLIGNPGRHVEFWIDVARQTGTYCSRIASIEIEEDVFERRDTGRRCSPIENPEGFNVRDIRAWAADLGVTYRPRLRLEPTFIFGYALGSGEGDRIREVDVEQAQAMTATSFRQTGLHRNRWRYNGVVSFRYYGEVLDPELFNIRILTLAFGLQPARRFSLDFSYHKYRQDQASKSFHEFEIGDTPSGLDPDLGHEWDVAIGYEPSRFYEVRLTAGVFSPGAALDDVGTPVAVRFQTRFRF